MFSQTQALEKRKKEKKKKSCGHPARILGEKKKKGERDAARADWPHQ